MRITVHGNALTAIVREIADQGNVVGVLGSLPGLTCEQALGVVERRKKIEGWSDGTDEAPGFTIVDDQPDLPADVYEFTKRFFERQWEQRRHEEWEKVCEAMSRWLKHEGEDELARQVIDGEWFDPCPE